MKIIAPLMVLYALAQFTTPNGFPIWINRDLVAAVTHSQPYDCNDNAKTKIIYGTSFSCVREEPADVVKKLSEDPK